MKRVLRYDGLLPNVMKNGEHVPATPEDLRAMRQFVDEHRADGNRLDIIVEGKTPGGNRKRAASIVRPWSDAGATWWNEALWSLSDTAWRASTQKRILARIKQGPPRID